MLTCSKPQMHGTNVRGADNCYYHNEPHYFTVSHARQTSGYISESVQPETSNMKSIVEHEE